MSLRGDEELNAKRKTVNGPIYEGYMMTIEFEMIRKDIEELEVYDDDVWVCGYPKSGTSWTQEMVWCICNNLDFIAAEEPMDTRFVYLEQSSVVRTDSARDQPDIITKSVDVVKNMKRPRFIKSHLPWELMPKQITSFEKRPKIIHVVRNPMDTCVSLHYFTKMLGLHNDDIEVLAKRFLENQVVFTPYLKNILSFWNQRNQPNVLCLKYEDMKANLSSVIDTVVEFLGKTLPSGGKDELIDHLNFDTMKQKKNIAPITVINLWQKINPEYDRNVHFLRSGKSGGYRSELSEETIELFKKEFMDKFKEAGLEFSI